MRHDAREPGPQVRARARRTLERGEPGVLRQVVGRRRIASQAPRQRSDPARVGQELVQTRRMGLHVVPCVRHAAYSATANAAVAANLGGLFESRVTIAEVRA